MTVAKQRFLTLLLTLTTVTATPHVVASTQNEDSIRNAAKRYVAERHPWQHQDHRIEVGRLDSRSRLPRCDRELKAFVPPRVQIKRRTTVGVRCEGQAAWTIYLPVTVQAYARVPVAARPLPAGTVLDDGNIRWVKRDISALGYGYIDDLNSNGGYRVSRAISQGAVITPQMVESAVLIRRGQTVRILAKFGSVDVSMTGVATMEASLGKRISVKNLKSGRLVEGVVRSSETVEVLL